MRRLTFALSLFLLVSACAPQTLVVSAPTSTPFVLPVLPDRTPVPTPTPVIISPTPAYYTVVAGDTLSGIAQRFGMPWDYLADQNEIENADSIFVGQIISIPQYPPLPSEGAPVKKIVVTLSTQTLDYYEDGVLTRSVLVSTGVSAHPTPPGSYRICEKLRLTRMTDGVTYDLMVKWVMYICNDDHPLGDGYSLHGTWWHHNFGVPMSHGCVNLSEPDALWLYRRLEVGQEIIINQ